MTRRAATAVATEEPRWADRTTPCPWTINVKVVNGELTRILGGEAPAFVKSEQSLYTGGPVWRIELVSPAWPRPAPKR